MSDPTSPTANRVRTFLEGNSVRLDGTFLSFAGTPIMSSSLRLLAQKPDGTVTSIPLSDDGSSVFGIVVLNAPGLWTFRFEGIAPVAVAAETRVMVLARSVPELV